MNLPDNSLLRNEIQSLISRAVELANESVSESTKRSYFSDWRAFLNFCDRYQLKSLPASPETICAFIAERADDVTPSTLIRGVCAIGKIHEWNGSDNPTQHHSVRVVLSGVRRSKRTAKIKSTAITLPMLKRVVSSLGDTAFEVRNKALILVGWFGALRRSELSNLSTQDIEIDDRGMLITLRSSKTDQYGHGQQIAIPRCLDTKFCPVAAIERWLDRARPDDWVFFAIGNIGPKWWLPADTKKDRPISGRMIANILKATFKSAGIPILGISGHSLRRGLATEASRLNVPEVSIQRHLRHASVAMVREYVEDRDRWTENPALAIYQEISPSPPQE